MRLQRAAGFGLTLLGFQVLGCSSEPEADGTLERARVDSDAPQTDDSEQPSSSTPDDKSSSEANGPAPEPNVTQEPSSTPAETDETPSTPQDPTVAPPSSPTSDMPSNPGGAEGQATGGVSNGGASTGGASSGGVAGDVEAAGGTVSPPADLGVRVEGPELVVSGKPFHIRGVGWNPVPAGQTHPAGLDFAGAAPVDIPLMRAGGFNVVRTYEPLLDRDVLDQLASAGIYVLNSVYPYGGDDPSVVTSRVEQVRDHPAMLAWLIGNEWNYNGLYVDLPFDDSVTRLRDVAALVAAADGDHPIATVYGELPDASLIGQMPEIDLWGINAYRGIGFGTLFSDWAMLSDKPMFLAEYGADAYNANTDSYDPESQRQAVVALTQEIAMNSRVFGDGPCVGGAVFEWADEWWKDASGSASQQDVGGIAPGGGPFPDQTFNEEWWGIVDIDRVPRPAYDALSSVFAELTSGQPR